MLWFFSFPDDEKNINITLLIYNEVKEKEDLSMINLGVSVYPDLSSLEEIEDYFKLASKYGVTRVFSSMFSVKDTPENILSYFKKFIAIAHQYNIKVSLDINPKFLGTLGASTSDLSVFHDIGCDIIRMDAPSGLKGDLELINNPYGITIEYNATTGFPIDDFFSHGVTKDQILACHNFYPQPYTAVSLQDFLDLTKPLKKYGIRIGAFISSNAPNTHGVWDAKFGLPTLEMHRYLPIDLQLRHLLSTKLVSDVFIGNAYASKEEFEAIKKVLDLYNKEVDEKLLEEMRQRFTNFGYSKVIFKPDLDKEITEVEKEILFDYFPHQNIGSYTDYLFRSKSSRVKYSKIGVPARKTTKTHFTRGDILITNDNYPHYAGELQIVLKDISNDQIRNYVGHLDEKEQLLLNELTRDDIVLFMK